jgi:hypothetical protein
VVKNIGAGICYLVGVENIDGAKVKALNQYDSIEVVPAGSIWAILRYIDLSSETSQIAIDFAARDAAIALRPLKIVRKTVGGVGVRASGIITISGTPVEDETITIGETEFVFKDSRTEAGEIEISAVNATQVTNIVTAVTADSTDVTAADGTGDTVDIVAVAFGVSGNDLVFETEATGVAVDGTGYLAGGVDAVVADFNFSPDANTTEQSIEIEDVIPAFARIVDVVIRTSAEFTGATTLVADVGTTEGGAELIASATIHDEDAIIAVAVEDAFPVAPVAAASSIFVNATPGANWDLVAVGKCTVNITYIEN